MEKHSPSNTELVTLWEQKTQDAVGAENTGSRCDTEPVMGLNAELTIFAPFIGWTYTEDEIKSLSKNSPVLNKELTGLPVAIVNNGKLYLNS